jgi:hypothetical protein
LLHICTGASSRREGQKPPPPDEARSTLLWLQFYSVAPDSYVLPEPLFSSRESSNDH